MNKTEAKLKILTIIKDTEKLIPISIEPDLPNSKILGGEPEWHNYELEIWERGEEIRQIITQHKSLFNDSELQDKIISICLNRNSKRERQPFIMLLWNKKSRHYSDRLVSQLNDKSVYGHVIEGLNKMGAEGYEDLIKPFCTDKKTWIRNQAIKYISKYDR